MVSFKNTIKSLVIPAIAIVIAVLITKHIDSLLPKDIATQNQIGGNFTLLNQDGKTVRGTDYRDRLMLVYFGFTHCPDECPTDLALMANILKKLGNDSKKIYPIFITTDPERDNPEVMKKYLNNFSPEIIGLTGTREQIASAANMYKVFYKKEKTNDMPEYTINHSAYMYLIGIDGKYITIFNHDTDEDKIIKEIKKYL